MPTITFYRQARRDGGIRTGIDIDGDTVIDQFVEGGGDMDPALDWYVDVRCKGAGLPRAGEAARRWLLGKERVITRVLRALAGEVPAGIDPGDWPLRKTARVGASGTTISVVCTAVRRVDAQQIAQVLTDIADNWRRRIEQLPTGKGALVHG
ncbi:MAG: hypothetical protein JWP03_1211 [Phycisphaerales bacterium]|jgi:hypothetical protein|nr:hypothetical protein [Phycisphaerales bacterium]HWE95008.1 hypothetical protein [Tepidisphaeraceae bacterium]